MRELFLLVTAAGALAMAYVAGAIQPVFANDQTGIVWGIAGLGVLGTISAGRWPGILDFLCDKNVLPLLGFVGTLIGFRWGIEGIVESNDPAKMAGIEVALVTTLAGAITHLWLESVRGVFRV